MSPETTTMLSTILGAAVGGGASFGTTFFLARRNSKDQAEQRKYDRDQAIRMRRGEAHLDIIQWFSLTRGKLKETIDNRATWDGTYSDLREQARMNALSKLYGSTRFQGATDLWQPAFFDALDTYSRYLDAWNRRQAGERDKQQEVERLASEAGRQVERLAAILEEIEGAARLEMD
jgi:hypothetical protein